MVSAVVKGRVGWHVAWTKVTDVEAVDGFWMYFEGFPDIWDRWRRIRNY